ncbi:Virus X resistance protein-like, coiled-coil domain [Sesbania bispinosa]|nr:Virus X resistance protein-like, coiled-coil domain [Sesbania bispinosa]
MADIAVSFALEQVFQLLKEETNLLRGVHKDFSDIKDELESIQALLKDADRRAGDEAETNDGIRTWVEQLREASFRIEDVIDEYLRLMHGANHPRCGDLVYRISNLIRTLIPRHRIASEIQDIKVTVREIKERSERYRFQISHEQGSSSSTRGTEDGRWRDPRLASLFIEETEIEWGDLEKPLLPSKFLTVKRETKDPLPQMLHKMDGKSLITEVREYLQHKRYLIFFDDVWQVDFSDQVEFAMPNNNKDSRIIITTRMMHVAEYFKKSFFVHVHNLQLLPPNKAWELFCKKVFRFGHCPAELENMSRQIVQKCKGLPLAIVAIGGLLSSKPKTIFEWDKVGQNLSMELGRNAHLTSLTKILSLSYNDLPYYLKPCLLYFGTYPEDYCISRVRLIRQWIAEGFIKYEKKRTLEQVAEEYLSELMQRSLVQVSKVGCDGKIKSCQIHDLLREVIIRKMEDLSFCHLVHEDNEAEAVERTRRLSIAATCSRDVLRSIGHSHIRAIYAFEIESPHPFTGRFYVKSKIVKILDFEGTSLNYVPDNLGNLFHLRYLNLRNTRVKVLPKSIGKLHNLETLDLRQTLVHELPIEINKLTKLRHLCVYNRNYEATYTILGFTTGVLMQKGIGCLTSLQNLYFVEVDRGELELIQELKELRQLRRLGLRRVRREHGYALCASIQAMKHLESLNITAIAEDEIIDLNLISSPPHQLMRLHLKARLLKLPEWIPKLEYLVKLRLALSMLTDDPLKCLKNLPNLLWLAILENAYDGATLHFQQGGFPKLKELFLAHLNRVDTIIIDKGALLVLEDFKFNNIPCLKEVPSGTKHLENLKLMDFANMPNEFVESIDPEKGQHYCIIKHVPLVFIRRKVGPKFHDYDIHPIHRPLNHEGTLFSNHYHTFWNYNWILLVLEEAILTIQEQFLHE